jgi:hypothetical protein
VAPFDKKISDRLAHVGTDAVPSEEDIQRFVEAVLREEIEQAKPGRPSASRMTSRAASGFTINLEWALGAGTSVRVMLMLVR